MSIGRIQTISGKNMLQKGLNKSDIEQGDIVLVDFSYSDLKRSKLRPALVMSNSMVRV